MTTKEMLELFTWFICLYMFVPNAFLPVNPNANHCKQIEFACLTAGPLFSVPTTWKVLVEGWGCGEIYPNTPNTWKRLQVIQPRFCRGVAFELPSAPCNKGNGVMKSLGNIGKHRGKMLESMLSLSLSLACSWEINDCLQIDFPFFFSCPWSRAFEIWENLSGPRSEPAKRCCGPSGYDSNEESWLGFINGWMNLQI